MPKAFMIRKPQQLQHSQQSEMASHVAFAASSSDAPQTMPLDLTRPSASASQRSYDGLLQRRLQAHPMSTPPATPPSSETSGSRSNSPSNSDATSSLCDTSSSSSPSLSHIPLHQHHQLIREFMPPSPPQFLPWASSPSSFSSSLIPSSLPVDSPSSTLHYASVPKRSLDASFNMSVNKKLRLHIPTPPPPPMIPSSSTLLTPTRHSPLSVSSLSPPALSYPALPLPPTPLKPCLWT
jgi:hypothetical protein